MKRFLKRVGYTLGGFLLFFGLFVGGIELYKATQGNFHEVTPHEFYRSAQLDKAQFRHYIKEKGLKTIINLRGASKGAAWYEDELNVSKSFGVAHYDFPMSAYRALTMSEAEQIVSIMKEAKKPILVHCHGGADRSALISALWLYAVKALQSEAAQKQFKLLYGYFPYLMWKDKEAMRNSFLHYVKTHPLMGQP